MSWKALSLVCTAALMLPTVAQAQAPAADAASPVVAARLVEHDVQMGQAFVGSVMPARETDVGSAVDGRVVAYPVRKGDYVKQGQTLAQLLTGLLEIEKHAAEAERDLRKEELRQLENGSRPEEIDRARAELGSRKALADYTQLKLKRTQKLFGNRTATEDELQDAISKWESANELYLQSKADYEMAVKGPREEEIAQSKARLAMAEEAVNRIDDQLGKHTIKSPFNGYVVQEYTQEGAWVAQAGMVARVIELDNVDVECQVLETFLPHVTVGSEVRVELPALPDRVFIGQVFRIVPQADLRSRTFPVKVRLKNEIVNDQPLIRSGLFARVVLPTGTVAKALLVPKDAIVLGGRTPVVWVMDSSDGKRGKVRPVDVEIGTAHEGWIQVKGDLKPGQTVVVEGNERLQPGQLVNAVRELAAPVSLQSSTPEQTAQAVEQR